MFALMWTMHIKSMTEILSPLPICTTVLHCQWRHNSFSFITIYWFDFFIFNITKYIFALISNNYLLDQLKVKNKFIFYIHSPEVFFIMKNLMYLEVRSATDKRQLWWILGVVLMYLFILALLILMYVLACLNVKNFDVFSLFLSGNVFYLV